MAQEGRHAAHEDRIAKSVVEERAPGIGAGFANQTAPARVDRVSGLASSTLPGFLPAGFRAAI